VKRYGDIVAVDAVDLTIDDGEVYGFLGPNGAGKTTTMRMLLGLIRPDAGSVRLFGRDAEHRTPQALTGVAGFVEAPRFYPYLSGRKNLELLAAFDGDGARGRIDDTLELVELRQRAKDKVGGYSQGMRQRLGLAASLLRDPRLLILDEPTNGLDPAGMRDMRILIRRLAERGITILLSSHLLAEVEELCTRVAIIRAGRIVFEGPLSEMHARTPGGNVSYRLRTTDQQRARAILAATGGVHGVAAADGDLTFVADEPTAVELSRTLVRDGLGIAALVPETTSLEEFFFELTEGAP